MAHEDQFITDPDHWSVLVPEMLVRDLAVSQGFYCGVLGFAEKFARPEDGFLYIEMGHAQLMLEEMPKDGDAAWSTGEMKPPFGRGVNFQIEVPDVQALHDRVQGAGIGLFRPMRTSWYREGAQENGQSEFLVQDPDGYLLRFMQHLGTRPAG
ncbi:MAG: VOC family protein [Paracoccaceae bacterium]|jgi:catechol 2,3-dioxygenase-like lactoylglutathione lyase family enzyme|nr:VOC family protein [Paracoccaceae bacterium]MDP5367844.1 VOC family protein [Paracoccaceae bacterium]